MEERAPIPACCRYQLGGVLEWIVDRRRTDESSQGYDVRIRNESIRNKGTIRYKIMPVRYLVSTSLLVTKITIEMM